MAFITDLVKGALPLNQLRKPDRKQQVNIFAMGDVGSTLLSGLFLLGGDWIHTIGIWDMNPDLIYRLETEYRQISTATHNRNFPEVKGLSRDEFFRGDVAVFCASASVPSLDYTKEDVRMMQWNRNRTLVEEWAKRGVASGFRGWMAIVSDPVDLLCKAAFMAARGMDSSWGPDRIRGYGLGVMHGRGCYYSRLESRFGRYEKEGRAFGPHGKGLVLANSVTHYDEEISRELTQKVVEANLVAREKGYKPFIAPAIASGALSIIDTLAGQWNYSAVYLGNQQQSAYFGMMNRLGVAGTEVESLDLPEGLYIRVRQSYEELCRRY